MVNKNNETTINKNRWLILLAVVMMTFMSCLDSSIVNVALPVMSKKLSVSMASIQWVVTSYLVIISASILLFGRLGDIKGKTKVFKAGIVLFTIGSFLCGISSTIEFLVISRVIQAIGAASTMSTSQGIITHIFPQNERGRALGISGSFVALGTLVGPPLGGAIVSAFKWEYIFLINIPVAIITFILAIKMFPKTSSVKDEDLDLKGAFLFGISIIIFFTSITKGQTIGFSDYRIVTAIILSLILFVIFILVEKKVKDPLLDLNIFNNSLFSISIFCGFISFVAGFCSNMIQPFYLQDALKFSPSTAGLFMMTYPIILAVVAPLSGHISDKIGSEILTFIGLIFTSSGLFLMSTLNLKSSSLTIIGFTSVMAVGNGLFQSPNNSLVMSTVDKSKLGIAGSVNALVRNLGMVVGVSLSTTLLYNRMSHKIGHRVVTFIHGREDVFIYGMKFVYWTAAAICLSGALLTAYRLYSKNRE